MNGLFTLTKCRIQNFPHMMPFTVNFAAVTLLKPNTQAMLIYWKTDWPLNKQSANQNYQNTPYWDWELSIPATNMEAATNDPFKDLLRWYIKKEVSSKSVSWSRGEIEDPPSIKIGYSEPTRFGRSRDPRRVLHPSRERLDFFRHCDTRFWMADEVLRFFVLDSDWLRQEFGFELNLGFFLTC